MSKKLGFWKVLRMFGKVQAVALELAQAVPELKRLDSDLRLNAAQDQDTEIVVGPARARIVRRILKPLIELGEEVREALGFPSG